MCKNILKKRLSLWYLLTLILSACLLLGTSRSGNPQIVHEDKKPYTEQIKNNYLQEPSAEIRADLLRPMVEYDDVGAFEIVFNAMMNDSGLVQKAAVELISHYYVRVPYYADDSLNSGIAFPEQITSQYKAVVDQLIHLAEGARYIDLRIQSIQSLIRMGAANEATLNKLYEIATGIGKESWEYVCLECHGRKRKEDIDVDSQFRAIGLIVTMNNRHIYEEKTKAYFKSIMNKLEPGTWLFNRIEGSIRRVIGQK